MSDVQKTGRYWGRGIASALLCLAATAEAAAEPSPLPELKPVAIEVDITSLPASEQAALVPLLRAARQMDALYLQQVWPGTRALIIERQSAEDSAAQAELDALNFSRVRGAGPGPHFSEEFRRRDRSVTSTLRNQQT